MLKFENILVEFVPEAFDLINESEATLLEIEKRLDRPEEFDISLLHNLFRFFHTLKGSSGLLKLESIVKLTHESETLLDILRSKNQYPNAEMVEIFLKTCDYLRTLFQEVEQTHRNPTIHPEMEEIVFTYHKIIQELSEETAKPKKKKSYEIFDNSTNGQKEENNPTVVDDKKDSVEPEIVWEKNRNGKKEIKVAEHKLDTLMDIMGELVIAESNVSQHSAIKNLRDSSFGQSINRLRKIVTDLQEVVLSTRMVEVSGVFQRMARLVRDLQKQSGKKIHLSIDGEETQIDKSIVELITDPIIHIIRNSVDHGMETPEERIAQGKSEIGNIYLSASNSVNEVWILIRDDGRGLSRKKIIEKAVLQGILTGDTSSLTDREIFPIIFQPGFSTAEEITEISGRGVGMDIVKKNIEKLGGKIDIHSQENKGTTFILRLPLSLGIMEGTIVRVGNNYFTIQTTEIREFVGLRDRNSIPIEEGKEVYEIRGKFIPIFSMNQVLNYSNPIQSDSKNQIMVVLELEDRILGIQVDEVMGNQSVVIKPLEGKIGEVQNVSGSTILGNGNVSLILDIKSIFRKFQGVLK